jgi:hypothetical protein
LVLKTLGFSAEDTSVLSFHEQEEEEEEEEEKKKKKSYC